MRFTFYVMFNVVQKWKNDVLKQFSSFDSTHLVKQKREN